MRRPSTARTLVTLVGLTTAYGCGPRLLYSGPPRPPAEVAIVRTRTSGVGASCYVQYVDGIETLGIWGQASEVYPERRLWSIGFAWGAPCRAAPRDAAYGARGA